MSEQAVWLSGWTAFQRGGSKRKGTKQAVCPTWLRNSMVTTGGTEGAEGWEVRGELAGVRRRRRSGVRLHRASDLRVSTQALTWKEMKWHDQTYILGDWLGGDYINGETNDGDSDQVVAGTWLEVIGSWRYFEGGPNRMCWWIGRRMKREEAKEIFTQLATGMELPLT